MEEEEPNRRYVSNDDVDEVAPHNPIHQNLNDPAEGIRQTLTNYFVTDGDRQFQYERA